MGSVAGEGSEQERGRMAQGWFVWHLCTGFAARFSELASLSSSASSILAVASIQHDLNNISKSRSWRSLNHESTSYVESRSGAECSIQFNS